MKNFHIKYYDNLNQISDDWTRIYNQSTLSYFCSLDWHYVVLSFLKKTFLTKRLNKLKYFTVHDDNDSQVKLLGFFYLLNNRKEKVVNFAHLMGPSDYYDFVYADDFNMSKKATLIQQILKDQKASGLRVGNLKSNSKLFDIVNSIEGMHCKALKCVSIQLTDNYDNYLKQLTKNARQNLRTAQNRITKNSLDLTFSLYQKQDVHKIDFAKLKSIYKLRNKNKQQNYSWKSKLYMKFDNLFGESVDMFDLKEVKNTEFTIGTLELDGKLAAYFFGFSRAGKIEINRVAIEDDFRFYSPGILLFNEFIKKGIEEKLKIVDLTVGDEKYKYDLGGTTHEIYNFNLI